MITEKRVEEELRPGDDEPAPNRTARTVRIAWPRTRRGWYLLLGLVGLVLAIWAVVRVTTGAGSGPRFQTARVDYTDIHATVEETGTVNPVNEVNVGTQVSGTVTSLNVDFNSIVHKGQILAALDPTSFQASAAQAHGGLNAATSSAAAAQSTAAQLAASARVALDNARQASAATFSAEANLRKAQAQLALSNATIARDRSLLAQGFIAQSQMDTDLAANRASQADVNAASAAVDSARAQAAAAQSQVAVATNQRAAASHQADASAAQVLSAQGQVQQADYNLARAVITSPIDGIVVSRNISIGQTVAASFQTPTLFVIASSLKDMQVDTSVSEADVGQLRAGAPADIVVPAYPNVIFRGTVQQVRVNPTTVQNVVTYDAIIGVHDASSRLKPGMTADVTISITTRQHVLAIPAAALLYRPSGGQGGGQSGSPSSGSSAATPPPIAGAPGSKVVVWVMRDSKMTSVPIIIGMSDGRNYEVRSGKLQPGDRVVIGQLQMHQVNNANPLGGGPGFGR